MVFDTKIATSLVVYAFLYCGLLDASFDFEDTVCLAATLLAMRPEARAYAPPLSAIPALCAAR